MHLKFTKEFLHLFLQVIEDCAEGFCGYRQIGNPRADISLFNFGPIKYYTSFGGAVAKIRDKVVFQKMSDLYSKFPIQSHSEYLSKVCSQSL